LSQEWIILGILNIRKLVSGKNSSQVEMQVQVILGHILNPFLPENGPHFAASNEFISGQGK
jgi:hypothetical protein